MARHRLLVPDRVMIKRLAGEGATGRKATAICRDIVVCHVEVAVVQHAIKYDEVSGSSPLKTRGRSILNMRGESGEPKISGTSNSKATNTAGRRTHVRT